MGLFERTSGPLVDIKAQYIELTTFSVEIRAFGDQTGRSEASDWADEKGCWSDRMLELLAAIQKGD